MPLCLGQVSHQYGRQVVLRDINLQISPGTVLGLLGPNGAGKTTLLSILACQMAPTSGTVEFQGHVVRNLQDARKARAHISLLPQDPQAPPRFTALDTVEYSAWLKGVDSREIRKRSIDMLGKLDLAAQANKAVDKLSGGMKQRVHLAAALVSQPQVLLLDEPTVGLDPAQRIALRKLISGLTDTAIVLSTHLVEDIAATCNQAIVLDSGSVVFAGSVEESQQIGAAAAADETSPLEAAYMQLLKVTS